MGSLPKHLKFLLDLDGKPCCKIHSVDLSGALGRSIIVDEAIAPSTFHGKKISTIEIDPIMFEFDTGIGAPMIKWISDTLNKRWSRRSGTVYALNGDKIQSGVEFLDAVITEVAIPSVGGMDKSDSNIKVKIQPERSNAVKAAGTFDLKEVAKYGTAISPSWTSGAFKVSITGLEHDCAAVKKIDSFVIKQGVKKLYTGNDRFPMIEPTKVEESNIILTIPSVSAKGFLDWHEKMLTSKLSDTKDGSIRYFPSGAAKNSLELDLRGLGIVSLSKPLGTTDMKVELFVESVSVRG